MKIQTLIVTAVASFAMATTAMSQTNLTAETAAPNTAPGVSVISLAEVAENAGVAAIQVATGQTLTNSVQNVAEGKTDIAAAPSRSRSNR